MSTSSLTDRLGYLLKHAQLRLTALTGPALEPLGVTGRELAVLTVLGAAEPLSQQEAAGRLGIDRTTMVALIDQLEGRDLLARRPDPADRRRNLVHLTAEGRRVRDAGDRAYRAAEQEFLGPAEADQLRRLLQRSLGLG